jgi:lipocalin-like protein
MNAAAPAPLPPPAPDLALGYWRLISREDYDATGRRNVDPILGADPLGMLCFAHGFFAAQFSKRDRAGVAPESTPAEARPNNSMAMNGYDAYFGRYSLDVMAGLIEVTLDAAISPGSVGQTYTRRIRVVGDELTIQLDTTAADGTSITRTLRFARVP